MISQARGQLVIKGSTLRELVRLAYHVRDFQVSGGPDWINSIRFDIVAKPFGRPTNDFLTQPAPALEALLTDKFRLRLHRATRRLPVYSLAVSKSGPEMRRSKVANCATFRWKVDLPAPGVEPPDCSGVEGGPNRQLNQTLIAAGMSVSGTPRDAALNTLLSRELDRDIADKTGLPGLFDVYLEWNRAATARRLASLERGETAFVEDPDSLSLFAAVQQQLGLELEMHKGPVEVLVIDRAEKPTGP